MPQIMNLVGNLLNPKPQPIGRQIFLLAMQKGQSLSALGATVGLSPQLMLQIVRSSALRISTTTVDRLILLLGGNMKTIMDAVTAQPNPKAPMLKDLLFEVRTKRRLSIWQLSVKTKIPQKTLQSYETGQLLPAPIPATRLAKALGVSLEKVAVSVTATAYRAHKAKERT